MRLLKPFRGEPRRLGILAGTFNPPTCAHLALAEAALAHVDRVLLTLPGVLPHKSWEGASREQREQMLTCVTEAREEFGAAVSDGGLFIDMVREARQLYPDAAFALVCGRDAAERIVGWDYGQPGAIYELLREFSLLVAPRQGSYEPPPSIRHAVQHLEGCRFDADSSTRVRETLRGGEDWRRLVPPEIAESVARIYG